MRSVISKEVNAHNSSFSVLNDATVVLTTHNHPSIYENQIARTACYVLHKSVKVPRFKQMRGGCELSEQLWERNVRGGWDSVPHRGDGGNWRANSPPPPTRMPMQNPIFIDMHTTSHSPRTSLQAFCRLWLHMERVRVVCSTFRT